MTEEVKKDIKLEAEVINGTETSKFGTFITKTFNKTTLRIAMLVSGLALVVILSVAQFGLDFQHINWGEWGSNLILLTGILIIFMVLGEGYKDYIRQNANGLYQKSLKVYRESRDKVNDITPFFPEYHAQKREKELKFKVIQILLNNGVVQATDIINNLSNNEIRSLEDKPLLKNNIEFLQLSHKQVEFVLNVKENTRIGITSPVYYLSEFETYDVISDQDLPEIIQRKRSAFKWSTRIIRVVSSIAISMVFVAFTVNEFMEGGDFQAWYNLVTRIFTAFSGLLSGCLLAWGLNSFDIRELQLKERFLHTYRIEYDLKVFKPLDMHELFVKQMEEAEEKERQIKEEQQVLNEEEAEALKQILKNDNQIKQITERKVINL